MRAQLPFSCRHGPRTRGSILLEVVLALGLFAAAATVISAGISASTQAVERVRLQNHAANLAISLMSELQMHARPVAPIGPESFEPPFQNWLYRIAIDQGDEIPGEPGALKAVEVIVWNPNENIVQRLTQLFRASETSAAESAENPIVP